MLSIYRKTSIISITVAIIAFVLSLFLINSENSFCIWSENICIGIFASGLLMIFSSVIGYVSEESRILIEYHWKLSELKECAVELESIPTNDSSIDTYYYASKKLNSLLTDYFAIIDTGFWCFKRKKIQKLLEIQTKLEQLKHVTANALIKMCAYRCGKKRDTGERNYTVENFRKDIQSYTKAVDNFDNSEMMLAIWLEKKEREYGEVVFKCKGETK